MKSLLCLFALSVPSFAAVSIPLTGSTESASWVLNSTNYAGPTYPQGFPGGQTAWTTPASPTSGSASALLNKVAGGGAFYATYMYTSGVNGSFRVYDESPQVSLATVVFQANMSQFVGTIVLNYNGGSQALAATAFLLNDNATGYDDYVWQWDLSGAGTVSSYEILFTDHIAISSLQLNTGSTYVQVIPEPSSTVLGAAALGLSFIRRRRA